VQPVTTDALASWQDTPVCAAIVGFVGRVTSVGQVRDYLCSGAAKILELILGDLCRRC